VAEHLLIRDDGMASFVIGHALQVFTGIMMSPEWSANNAGALDWRAAHEKNRGRSRRDHRESNE
jgi:hypothetical protein